MRVLVIEDEQETAGLIKALLERKLSAEVELSADCESARRALSASGFDLVTLDYSLPDCDGLDLLDEITAQPDHPPVVMITGHGDEELAYLTFRMGASGYATKGANLPVQLADAAEWALADAEARRAAADQSRQDDRLKGLLETVHWLSRDLRDAIENLDMKADELERSLTAGGTGGKSELLGPLRQAIQRAETITGRMSRMTEPDRGSGRSRGEGG